MVRLVDVVPLPDFPEGGYAGRQHRHPRRVGDRTGTVKEKRIIYESDRGLFSPDPVAAFVVFFGCGVDFAASIMACDNHLDPHQPKSVTCNPQGKGGCEAFAPLHVCRPPSARPPAGGAARTVNLVEKRECRAVAARPSGPPGRAEPSPEPGRPAARERRSADRRGPLRRPTGAAACGPGVRPARGPSPLPFRHGGRCRRKADGGSFGSQRFLFPPRQARDGGAYATRVGPRLSTARHLVAFPRQGEAEDEEGVCRTFPPEGSLRARQWVVQTPSPVSRRVFVIRMPGLWRGGSGVDIPNRL